MSKPKNRVTPGISPSTKYLFAPLATGKVCRACGKPEAMTRTHKDTHAQDTRHSTCFKCIPTWDTQFNYREDRPNLMRVDDYLDDSYNVAAMTKQRSE
jgi:hypothetical protein